VQFTGQQYICLFHEIVKDRCLNGSGNLTKRLKIKERQAVIREPAL